MKKLYFFFPIKEFIKLTVILCSLFFVIGYTNTTAEAQVVVTENFNGATMPSGWSVIKITGTDPNNDWDVTNPYGACCPAIGGGGPFSTSGGNCARYRSNFIPTAGNSAGLMSPPFDLSARGANPAPFSFQMFRNNFFPADNIQVYANTIPSLSGATLLTTVAPSPISNIIHRHIGLLPAVGTQGWYTYNYSLPAGFNTSATYIIIVGTAAGGGHHIYVDDFNITTWPSPMSYVSSQLFFQNTSSVASGSTGALIVGLNIKMNGSLSAINCDSILMIPNGTTNLANITNAKLYYTGNSSSFSTATQYGANVPIPGAFSTMKFGSAARPLINGDNYFWLTYDVNGPQGNFVDADFYGSKLSDAANLLKTPSPQSLFGAREIGVSYCQPTMTVGTAWANYTNNDYVASVQFTGETPGPIINNSLNTVWSPALPCPAGTCPFASHPPDYELFAPDATHTTILKEGATYFPLYIQVGTWFSSNYVAAWIDWNGDGDFNDVIGGISEKINQSGPLPGSGSVNWIVTVPAPGSPGLINGNTIMRVREVFVGTNISPCGSYTYGETEDYVVTIVPDCGAGVKTWLGFTNDWNNPANWCPSIPTLADIAVIPGKAGTPGYIMPKITPGVNATAKTLRVNSPDTLYVDASNSASLTLADSMIIRGTVQIESGYLGSCTMGNGTFTNLIETPFAGNSTDARMQIIYTATELQQCGMKGGDVISEIDFHMFRRRNTAGYTNFNISYYHTSLNAFASATNALPQLTAPTTVYSNPSLLLPTWIPAPNGAGIIPLVLNGAPMVWNGVDNIVVDICFDKTTLSGGTISDIVYQTQTLGRKSVLLHQSKPNSNPGFGVTWSGCSATGPFATPPSPTNPSIISEYRPNLTFKYDRPYSVFPINQRGHWANNGVFNAGKSNVIFSGGATGQNIAGTNTSTFNELTINKPGTVTQVTPAVVNNIFRLTLGFFNLNQKTLRITNPLPAGMQRTTGVLLSETTPPNHGFLQWDIGATAGPHTVSFGNSFGTHLPFSLNQIGGSNIGSLVIATYPTAANNTPYPTGVTHVNGPLAGGDNSANTVDRFWIINQSGGGAVNANLTFSYANIEEAQLNPNDAKRPQRWINALGAWENSGAGGTPYAAIPGARSVTRLGVTSLVNNPWTISNDVSPLPIELITFDAISEIDKSKIWWVTASEINVDHFTIERTTDGQLFEFIDQQASNSPSTQTKEYVTYDYNPLNGLQYYRLTSTDIDGSREYSKLAPVYFGDKEIFEINSVFANSQSGSIDILFDYNSELPVTYIVSDVFGRVITKEDNLNAKKGVNLITLSTNLSKGVYFITIKNTKELVSKKFAY